MRGNFFDSPREGLFSPFIITPLFLHCLDTSHGSSTDVVVFRAPRGFKTPRNETVVHPRSDRSEIWRSFSSSTHACSRHSVGCAKTAPLLSGHSRFVWFILQLEGRASHPAHAGSPPTLARSGHHGARTRECPSAPTVGVRLLVPSRSSRNRRTRQNNRSGVRWHFAMLHSAFGSNSEAGVIFAHHPARLWRARSRRGARVGSWVRSSPRRSIVRDAATRACGPADRSRRPPTVFPGPRLTSRSTGKTALGSVRPPCSKMLLNPASLDSPS